MAKPRDEGTKKLRFRVGRWVSWSGSISPARGSAAGSVQLTSPFRSPLLTSILYLALAVVVLAFPVTALVTVAILVTFSAFYAVLWWRGHSRCGSSWASPSASA